MNKKGFTASTIVILGILMFATAGIVGYSFSNYKADKYISELEGRMAYLENQNSQNTEDLSDLSVLAVNIQEETFRQLYLNVSQQNAELDASLEVLKEDIKENYKPRRSGGGSSVFIPASPIS